MLMGNQIAFRIDFNNILIALVVCLFITILSGGYTAFYLSSLEPVIILRGGFRPGSKDSLRKILIGFQFFLSIGVMIATLIIYRQINYMFTTDTGVDRKNILVINAGYWEHSDDFIKAIKSENPNIMDASFAFMTPYNATYNYTGVSWAGSPEEVKEIEIAKIFCDHHYASTFGLKMISGEFIQSGLDRLNEESENADHIVINEAFQRMMGVDNPIGITLYPENGKITGVVKDFNFKPLKEPITPLIFSYNPPAHTKLYIKITGNNKKETIDYIRDKYNEMGGYLQKARPFAYFTVEDDYKAMYKSELRTIKILSIFSILSLCLSVLGIIGMVLFLVETRTKEIAIRRINGAETKDIIYLFILNFVKIIGFSSVIAIPVCIFILQRWIQAYAYRTSMSWWIFILVPTTVTLITAVGISLQVFFTARQNPAEMVKRQ
jgi:putative ABC transport system permease protein